MTTPGVRGRPREHIGLYVWFSLTGLCTIAVLAVLTRFPFLYFTRIEVRGDTQVPHAELISQLRAYPLHSFVGRLLGYNNFLLWNGGSVTLDDLNISRTEIARDIVHRALQVTVTDRARSLVWCSDALRCVWVDADGIAFQYAPFAEGQLITTVSEQALASPVLGMGMLPSGQFARLRRVFELLQHASLPMSGAAFERDTADLYVTLRSGALFAFNLRVDPEFVATALPELVARKDFANIAHADFRVANKVYYSMNDGSLLPQ